LKRGIGVHHAGLLPIIKEATEVLFQMARPRSTSTAKSVLPVPLF
jgi:hypothetical protein